MSSTILESSDVFRDDMLERWFFLQEDRNGRPGGKKEKVEGGGKCATTFRVGLSQERDHSNQLQSSNQLREAYLWSNHL